MHNQNNGSIVFKLCISIVWGGGGMCMWPFVVSSLPKEAVHALTTPGAGAPPPQPLQEQQRI